MYTAQHFSRLKQQPIARRITSNSIKYVQKLQLFLIDIIVRYVVKITISLCINANNKIVKARSNILLRVFSKANITSFLKYSVYFQHAIIGYTNGGYIQEV